MTQAQIISDHIAQLRSQLATYREHLSFWERQPDLGVGGFNRQDAIKLCKQCIAQCLSAIEILEGKHT